MKKKLLSLGALPVGLKGRFYGVPYNVLVQYDLSGHVSAMVYDTSTGGLIVSITGKGKQKEADVMASYIFARQAGESRAELKTVQKDVRKFVSQLSEEVKEHNDKQKTPKPVKVVNAKAKKSQQQKKGSVVKYIDERGKEDKTYKVIRSEKGAFKKFQRVAGVDDCNHAKCKKCGGLYVKNLFLGSVSDVCSPKCLAATKDACSCKCGGRFHQGKNYSLLKSKAGI